jgi:hypothetical protein
MGDTRALERGLMQGGGYLASAIVEWVLAALTTQLAGLAVAFAVSRQHGVRAALLALRFVPPPLPWPRRGSRTTPARRAAARSRRERRTGLGAIPGGKLPTELIRDADWSICHTARV